MKMMMTMTMIMMIRRSIIIIMLLIIACFKRVGHLKAYYCLTGSRDQNKIRLRIFC